LESELHGRRQCISLNTISAPARAPANVPAGTFPDYDDGRQQVYYETWRAWKEEF